MDYEETQVLLAQYGLTGGTGFAGYTDASLDPESPVTSEEFDEALEALVHAAVRRKRVQAYVDENENTYENPNTQE